MTRTAQRFPLPTGVLTLHVEGAAAHQLDDYLHVAARRNPKRGFLFVSHLLGKHVPVSLGRLRKTYDLLAQQLQPTLAEREGDVLVVGMAETATLLGYGVWRALAQHERERNVFFLQTTRYCAEGAAWAFEESHSHAPQQWIQGLDDLALDRVRHVVLVDDELSTGRTFVALEALLRRHLPQIEDVQWACLTDFRPDEFRTHPAAALLQGQWSFEAEGTLPSLPEPDLAPVDPAQLQADFGRQRPLDPAGREARLARASKWLAGLRVRGRVLVLGTGEFMPLPFELAEVLESRPDVESVDFQATTRSPALMPKLDLGVDHYGEGVPQFIYHYDRSAYDAVVVVVETPPNERIRELAQRLEAHLVGPGLAEEGA